MIYALHVHDVDGFCACLRRFDNCQNEWRRGNLRCWSYSSQCTRSGVNTESQNGLV